MKKLRILVATNHYGPEVRETELPATLVRELAEMGHDVTVVAVSWRSPPGAPPRIYHEDFGARVLFVTPRLIGRFGGVVRRITKWTATPAHSYLATRRALRGEKFDLLIGYAPAVASAGPFQWGLKHSRKSFLWIPDFFPFHHRLLGQIPGGPVFHIARRIENAFFRRFDVLGCFAPAAIDYLRRHYSLRPEQKAAWVPQWGVTYPPPPVDRDETRRRYHLPLDKKIVLFGGQIELGRGIEDILETARLASAQRPDLFFLFVGGGTLVPLVRKAAERENPNVGLIGSVPRDEYLQLISACDLGIVATLSELSIPAFPSKTWDYLRAGLPVAASVEFLSEQSGVDYSALVEERGFGRSVEAGNPDKFLACITSILDDPAEMERMRAAGRETLAEVHDVGRNARRILELTGLAD